MARTSKAHVLPSEWAAAKAGLRKGRGGFKPSQVKPLTREQHREIVHDKRTLGLSTDTLIVNPASTATALLLVLDELKRTEMRQLPYDSLRRAALVNEEAGETLQAALDLTRFDLPPRDTRILREKMRAELVQTASMAVTVLAAMVREDSDVDPRPIEWDDKKKALRYRGKPPQVKQQMKRVARKR